MKPSILLEKNRTSRKENRSAKQDRRDSLDRRIKRDPNYIGEARRMIIDRRLRVSNRRVPGSTSSTG